MSTPSPNIAAGTPAHEVGLRIGTALLTLSFLGPHSALAQGPAADPRTGLIGTWRLVEFWDRDSSSGPLVYRYGRNPSGYFVYDPTGHVSIQIMRGPDPFRVDSARGEQWFERGTLDELRHASGDFRAYFGTYAVDSARGLIWHNVEGDSRGLYTGTRQRRRFRLSGDTLLIGNDTTARRLLVRVR